MVLEKGKYYHFYNRSNNKEVVFKKEENYKFFLERYRKHLQDYFLTLAYCLMPTHFHFVVKVISADDLLLKKNIAALLSGYTKAVNKVYSRHGSLFQPRSKAKEIDDETYLLTLITYVHQNPLRAKLVRQLHDWKFSSYSDLAGFRDGSLPDKRFILQYFPTLEDFRKYSQEIVVEVNRRYWV